jgi:hypothetical protein
MSRRDTARVTPRDVIRHREPDHFELMEIREGSEADGLFGHIVVG